MNANYNRARRGAATSLLLATGCFDPPPTVSTSGGSSSTGVGHGATRDDVGDHSDSGLDSSSTVADGSGSTTGVSSGCTPPTGVTDQLTVFQGQTLLVDAPGVLDNDLDADGEGLEVAPSTIQSDYGADVDINADGSVTYVPPAWLWGLDSFEYEACCAGSQPIACDTVRVDVLVRPVSIALTDVERPHGGFVIEGQGPGDRAGEAVGPGGDINGDGFDDILVGAPAQSYSGLSAGRTYVVFGKDDLNPVPLDAVVQGEGGFALHGEAAEDRSGQSIDGVGDIDGDGLADFIVGAPGAVADGVADAGRAYVIYGSIHGDVGTGAIALSAIASGNGGFAINGEPVAGGRLGGCVRGIGDVDGGGAPDLMTTAGGVGASLNAGRAYVLFGEGSYRTPIHASSLSAATTDGVVLEGEASQDRLNRGSWVGDLDGDGRDEIGLGSYLSDPNGPLSGSVWIVNGSSLWGGSSSIIYLGDVSETVPGIQLTGEYDWDEFGYDLDGIGDVDGDGYEDLLVGAYRADPNGVDSGRVYLYFGGPSGVSADDVLHFEGEAAGNWAGVRLSGVGDFDGDGLSDLVIGSPGAGGHGRCYLVYGSSALRAEERIQLSSIAGDWGFVLEGDSGSDAYCVPVSSAGDVNDDGLDDLLIAARDSDDNGEDSGRVYVVLGVPSSW